MDKFLLTITATLEIKIFNRKTSISLKNNEFLVELLNYQDSILQNMIANVKIQFENSLFKKRNYLDIKTYKNNSKKIGCKSILKNSLQPIIGSFC